MPFLLDTNSWIHYLKHAQSPIRSQLEQRQPNEIFTCSVVRAELLHGAQKYGNKERRIATVESALAPFRSLPFDDEAAAAYASIRHALESTGMTIGPYDLQIAAICVTHDLVLVTNNSGEFSRVPALQAVDWLQARD